MTLEEIHTQEKLTIRSLNICNDNGLKELKDIIKYYKDHRTFTDLKNCGVKSNQELIELSLKYIENVNLNEKIVVEIPQLNEIPLLNIISNLNRSQREIVNSFIEINVNTLTIRTQNAIKLFSEDNLRIKNISEKFLCNNGIKIKKLKNIGAKSEIELDNFLEELIEFIMDAYKNADDLIPLKNKFLIQRTFSISNIPDNILGSQSIFKLIDFLIPKNAIHEIKQNAIFVNSIKIYNKQPELTLENIAEGLKISKERARQIRKLCLEELFIKLQFIKNLNDDLLENYEIDKNQDFIFVDEITMDKINGLNETNFSKEFTAYLIYIFLSEEFELVGHLEDVLLPKYFNSRNRHNWNHFYIISKKLYHEFDFVGLADDMDSRLKERIEESYTFNFKSYFANFLKNNNYQALALVSKVAEKMINNEFGIYISLDDNIVFNRNSIKQAYEYAFEALEFIGKPSKVNIITKKILELHPDYITEDSKVRASMKRKFGFVPVGRRSIFGLKKWEKELKDFKGGTIRSIAFDYLKNNPDPKHISEITAYVLKFRPKSNELSILQNLKLDHSGTFVFFKKSFIGIAGNKYNESFNFLANTKIANIKSWEERFDDLLLFLNEYKRFPFSSGCSEDEIKLYRWYKNQLGNIKRGTLKNNKERLINKITNSYEKVTKTRKQKINNSEKFKKLEEFVIENGRLPSAIKNGENNLYYFFYRQRKLFESGTLEKNDENNFRQISRKIEKYIYEN